MSGAASRRRHVALMTAPFRMTKSLFARRVYSSLQYAPHSRRRLKLVVIYARSGPTVRELFLDLPRPG